jgi:hypothetical protein
MYNFKDFYESKQNLFYRDSCATKHSEFNTVFEYYFDIDNKNVFITHSNINRGLSISESMVYIIDYLRKINRHLNLNEFNFFHIQKNSAKYYMFYFKVNDFNIYENIKCYDKDDMIGLLKEIKNCKDESLKLELNKILKNSIEIYNILNNKNTRKDPGDE